MIKLGRSFGIVFPLVLILNAQHNPPPLHKQGPSADASRPSSPWPPSLEHQLERAAAL